MDGANVDRLSRLVARSSTRRSALTLAAVLGLGVSGAGAGKKRKNLCKGGCGPCTVCKKKGNRKKCVNVANGTACDGGTCQAGTCCLSTCTGLGNVCGPVSNGCGGTVTCTCGFGAAPACDGGQCTTCATTCGTDCDVCLTRVDGTTRCGKEGSASCGSPCSSDVDCPPGKPFCAIGQTFRATGVSLDFLAACGASTPGVCADSPDC